MNYKTQGDDLYDLFGKYGAVRQIRLGNEAKSRGTAFVVYEDVLDVSVFIRVLWVISTGWRDVAVRVEVGWMAADAFVALHLF